MNRIITTVAAACALPAVFAAAPRAANATFSQDQSSRRVEISYDLLDAPAIVTIDIQTNAGNSVWMSVGGEHFTSVWGDINRMVQPGSGRKAYWRPYRDLPGLDFRNSEIRAVVTAWSTNMPPPYMCVDLSVKSKVKYYASAECVPGGVTNDIYKLTKMLLRKIPAAGQTFRVGSPVNEADRETDGRENAHMVTLTEDFYIGVYEVTQEQYRQLTGETHTEPENRGPMQPVNRVNPDMLLGANCLFPANETVTSGSFFGKLRTWTSVDGFFLPTGAQWCFAARAGSELRYYWGNDKSLADDYCWHSGNCKLSGESKNHSHDVGTRLPNAYGLYDIVGNVEEIVADWYIYYAGNEYDVDPKGPATAQRTSGGASAREVRGASFNRPNNLNSHNFTGGVGVNADVHTVGFRVKCAAIGY